MGNDERETSRAESETELKVTDRRLFTSDGQLRGDVDEEPAVEEPAAEAVRDEGSTQQPEFERDRAQRR